MNIYYIRKESFCKWPWNQEIDEKWVEYSRSKRKFKEFMRTDVSLNMEERKEAVAKELKIKKSRIKLIKG